MAYSGVLDDIRTCVNLGVPTRVPVFGITGEFDVRAVVTFAQPVILERAMGD